MNGDVCEDCGAELTGDWWGGIVKRQPDGSVTHTPHCRPCYERYWREYKVLTYCDLCYRNLTAHYEVLTAYTVLVCSTCGERQRIADRDHIHLPEATQDRIQAMAVPDGGIFT